MVLPTEVTIKQEVDDYEDEPKYTSNFDVEVKVEIESSQVTDDIENTDWCIQNEAKFRHDEADELDVVDFEKLSEYCIQQCFFCGDVFMDSFTLLQHNLGHLELRVTPITQQKYQCNDCLQYFKNKSILLKHILEENEEPSQNLLVTREVLERKPEPPQELLIDKSLNKTQIMHQCKYCGKVMNYKNWHSHITEVHGNNRYQCTKCNATFKCVRYLKRHDLYVHQGAVRNQGKAQLLQEVKCNLCSAVLAHKHALKTHIRNCHCEKIKCELCDTELKKSYMSSHMRRVHYDDGRQYECDCGKKFRSPRYLRVHIKNAHTKKS